MQLLLHISFSGGLGRGGRNSELLAKVILSNVSSEVSQMKSRAYLGCLFHCSLLFRTLISDVPITSANGTDVGISAILCCIGTSLFIGILALEDIWCMTSSHFCMNPLGRYPQELIPCRKGFELAWAREHNVLSLTAVASRVRGRDTHVRVTWL